MSSSADYAFMISDGYGTVFVPPKEYSAQECMNNELFSAVCLYDGRYLSDSHLLQYFKEVKADVSLDDIRKGLSTFEKRYAEPGFLGLVDVYDNTYVVYKAPPWAVCGMKLQEYGISFYRYKEIYNKPEVRFSGAYWEDIHRRMDSNFPKLLQPTEALYVGSNQFFL